MTVKTFAPEVKSEAANQTAPQTVGPYTMSMSNDSVATINITPTSSQAVYTGTNNLSVTNTCDAGATITMTTNSTSSNSLTRPAVNSDTLTKDIIATTSTSLDNNSWGYALNNSSTYYAVPKKGQTAATIYNATAAQTSALTVPVKFGVKTNNELPSGTYTNDVVYTMTPKSSCLSYSVTWNYDGGTAKAGATYPTSLSWGQTVNLSTLTPTKDGYTFTGWTNGTSTFTGSETAANLNSANAKSVTVTAQYRANCTGNCTEIDISINQSIGYDYTGKSVGVTFKRSGYYKLEAWGAEGGVGYTSYGGYGGYAYGTAQLSSGDVRYIYVGGKPTKNSCSTSSSGGIGYQNYRDVAGWNGGGNGDSGNNWSAGAGGGATDFSLKGSGNSTSWNTTEHLYSRILVAGGGGGGGHTSTTPGGGHGGGYIGGIGQSSGANGGSFNSGYAFGIGETSPGAGDCDSSGSNDNGAGGGGWYGGYAFQATDGNGGGGSGYIYNSASEQYYPSGKLVNSSHYLSSARMYQYSTGCTSSTATATYTVCTSSTGHAVANAANTGDGYAKITYLGT